MASVTTAGRSWAISYTVVVVAPTASGTLTVRSARSVREEVALMAIFLWREVKRAERYEQLYNEEHRKRMEAEQKCKDCPYRKK
ncbi:MAG: hypothetical protein IKK15_05185 [Akkermansia sp.]|nr:hypothetical protein [Akkermansia sp.]